MKCEAVIRGKECGRTAVCSGVVTVRACEMHRKRSGFFEDKQIDNQGETK